MRRLASCSKELSVTGWEALRALTRREFYAGDLETLSGRPNSYSLEKAMKFPISLTKVWSDEPFSYRRNSKHIRDNRVGFRSVWLVTRGRLKIVRSSGVLCVAAGEMAIMNTNLPFQASSECESNGIFEAYAVMVPADLFLAHLGSADELTDAFPLCGPDNGLVESLLEVMIRHGETLGKSAAQPLAESFLQAIAQCMRSSQRAPVPRKREKLADRRFADIEAHITLNATDPDLSYDKVAASCGISPRYLCYLLKSHDTSFSELLWNNRLPKARDWLMSPTMQEFPIHEISFMAGFKSPAHFSRMFKNCYGYSPSEFRARHQVQEEYLDREGATVVALPLPTALPNSGDCQRYLSHAASA